MSYIINNSRGNVIAIVADGTVNTTATDLTLVGRGVTNYGTAESENYVYLLENFANSTAPLLPILGQLWYNSNTDTISAYSSANSWSALASHDYVQAQKVSPAFSGIPTAPTAANGTSTTQIATTAFVQAVAVSLGTLSTQNANAVAITGGTITGVSPIAVASGGTGASSFTSGALLKGAGTSAVTTASAADIAGQIGTLPIANGGTGSSNATDARANLGAAASATTVTVGSGLTGGGSLASNMTIAFAANSNGYGTRYVSTAAPTGGSDGDLWYQI